MKRTLVKALRTRGVDVLTAFEAYMIDREDDEHLDYATAQGRVLYTFNVGHFYDLHRTYLEVGQSHGGMILAQQKRYSVGEQMRRLLRLIATKTAEEMKNHVEFLSAWN